jgi:signal transduction histidine kinase
MSVQQWYVPTLSEIIALGEQSLGQDESIADSAPVTTPQRRSQIERQWCGAIGSLNDLLESSLAHPEAGTALVLSGQSPVLRSSLAPQIDHWTFTTEPSLTDWLPSHLLPAAEAEPLRTAANHFTLPLLPQDPLSNEQFCLALTQTFGVVMTLGSDATGEPVFLFSFVPDVVRQAWQALRSRLMLSAPHVLSQIDPLVQQCAPVEPSYRLVTQFHRRMLANLPEPKSRITHTVKPVGRAANLSKTAKTVAANTGTANVSSKTATKTKPVKGMSATVDAATGRADVDILRAIAHEVRTPLTTIRTLTRLLLRRKDVTADVAKRLSMIDRECTQQIDRFNLIFRAAELETQTTKACPHSLASISLAQVFQDGIPQWQTKASQRNLNLDVRLPQTLPMVVSDPVMLHQMLNGLIDRITHTLPSGSHIQLQVSLAGSQLKLQLRSLSEDDRHSSGFFAPTLQSIGDLLMFQPETGNLSLNLDVTKNLFQALGGKLIVRNRPDYGEVVTIFLPLETRET